MRGATARALRKNAADAAHQTAAYMAPPIQTAIDNEHKTRQRVSDLEMRVDGLYGFKARGFWGRLRWLVLGR